MKKSKKDAEGKEKGTKEKAASAPSSSFDLEGLAVETDYVSANGKPERVVIRSGKPRKEEFVFVYADQHVDVYLCELGREQGLPTHVVHPALIKERPELGDVMKLRRLFLAINADNDPFVWETAIPDPIQQNTWVTSGLRAVERASKGWVRVVPVKRTQSYLIYNPPQKISDPPKEPEYTIKQAAEIAYRDRIITSLDHQLIKPLLGDLVV